MTATAHMPPLALIAGGLATRMGERARREPKSLFSVAGEPFIAHQMRLLAREKVSRVVVCIGHLGHMIRDFLGDGRRFGLSVAYSDDGDTLAGTGGAVRNALPLLGERFLVMYGDSYLDIPFAPVVEAFDAAGLPALMTIFENKDRWDRSNTSCRDGRILRHDKARRTADMAFIDYGLGMFRADAFLPWIGRPSFDLSEVYGRLAENGQLAGFEVRRRFYEIGSESGLRELDAHLTLTDGRG